MKTDLNFLSPEWLYVFNKAKAQIEDCVRELSSQGIDHDRCNYLRGKIEAMRLIVEVDTAHFPDLSVKPFH